MTYGRYVKFENIYNHSCPLYRKKNISEDDQCITFDALYDQYMCDGAQYKKQNILVSLQKILTHSLPVALYPEEKLVQNK